MATNDFFKTMFSAPSEKKEEKKSSGGFFEQMFSTPEPVKVQPVSPNRQDFDSRPKRFASDLPDELVSMGEQKGNKLFIPQLPVPNKFAEYSGREFLLEPEESVKGFGEEQNQKIDKFYQDEVDQLGGETAKMKDNIRRRNIDFFQRGRDEEDERIKDLYEKGGIPKIQAVAANVRQSAGDINKGFWSGVGGFMPSLFSGALSLVKTPMELSEQAINTVGGGDKKFSATSYIEGMQKTLSEDKQSFADETAWRGKEAYWSSVAGGAVASVSTALVTGGMSAKTLLPAAVLSVPTYGEIYEGMRENDAGALKSVGIALPTAAAVMAMEKLALNQWFKIPQGKSLLSHTVTSFALAELPQEVSQTAIENAVKKLTFSPDTNVTDGFLESAVGAAFGSGIMAGGVAISNKDQAENIAKFEKEKDKLYESVRKSGVSDQEARDAVDYVADITTRTLDGFRNKVGEKIIREVKDNAEIDTNKIITEVETQRPNRIPKNENERVQLEQLDRIREDKKDLEAEVISEEGSASIYTFKDSAGKFQVQVSSDNVLVPFTGQFESRTDAFENAIGILSSKAEPAIVNGLIDSKQSRSETFAKLGKATKVSPEQIEQVSKTRYDDNIDQLVEDFVVAEGNEALSTQGVEKIALKKEVVNRTPISIQSEIDVKVQERIKKVGNEKEITRLNGEIKELQSELEFSSSEEAPKIKSKKEKTPKTDKSKVDRFKVLSEKTRSSDFASLTEKKQTESLAEMADLQLELQEKGLIKDGDLKGSKFASVGKFKDGTPIMSADLTKVRPVPLPDLVQMVEDLTGNKPKISNLRASINGKFIPSKDGRIELNAELFSDTEQVSKTLAHEIGHLVDWFPNKDMKRGNLLGRLNTLSKFMKGELNGVKNKEVRDELWKVTSFWRPIPKGASASYIRYRKSSAELYADALSVLLNSPGLLQELAPTFLAEFQSKLHKKPEVMKAYASIQNMLNDENITLSKEHLDRFQKQFQSGEEMAIQMNEKLKMERGEREGKYAEGVMRGIIDQNQEFLSLQKRLEKTGVKLRPEDTPRYFLDEKGLEANQVAVEFESKFMPIIESIKDSKIDLNDFGTMLALQRIINGDRAEIANPLGMQDSFAESIFGKLGEDDFGSVKKFTGVDKDYTNLQSKMGEENFRNALKLADKLRAETKEIFLSAKDLFTDEQMAMFEENDFYVPFKVLKYLDKKTTFKVQKQKGTFEEIQNPLYSSLDKVAAVTIASNRNKIIKKSMDFLTKYYPSKIEPAKMVMIGKGQFVFQKKDGGNNLLSELVVWREKGKSKAAYVSQKAHKAIKYNSFDDETILNPVKWANNKVLKPLFVGYSIGFIMNNTRRDPQDLAKAGVALHKVPGRYMAAAKIAVHRVWGNGNEESKKAVLEMQKENALTPYFIDTFLTGGRYDEFELSQALTKAGVITPEAPKFLEQFEQVKKLSEFFETLPKVALWLDLKDKGVNSTKRAYQVRSNVGIINPYRGGTLTQATNQLFLFSNQALQGKRAKLKIATDPETAGQYWAKTALLNIAPKAFMQLALLGLLGEWLKDFMEKVPETDKYKKTVVPLYKDENGNAVYFPLAQDFEGAFMGSLFYQFWDTFTNEKTTEKDVQGIFRTIRNEIPGFSPAVALPMHVSNMSMGNNIYDSFTQKNVFSDEEMSAGGFRKWDKYMKWQWNQFFTTIYRFRAERVEEKTGLQKAYEMPLLGTVIESFAKTSNYGEQQFLNDVIDRANKKKTNQSLEERDMVKESVKTLQTQWGNRDIPSEAVAQESADLMVEIFKKYPPRSSELKSKFRNLNKKLDSYIVFGADDAKMISLQSSKSKGTDVQLAVIEELESRMNSQDFTGMLLSAVSAGIVSENTLLKYAQDKNE